jgi:general secretion pathway protein D
MAHTLRHLSVERANAALDLLELPQDARVAAEPNALVLTGTPEQLKRADLVLTLMDCREDYRIEKLGPASLVRRLPSNAQIEAALGDVVIGTFHEPPGRGAHLCGIIDLHGDSVLAVVPVRCRDRLHALLADAPQSSLDPSRAAGAGSQAALRNVFTRTAPDDGRAEQDPSASEAVVTLVEMAAPSDPNVENRTVRQSADTQGTGSEPPKTVTISLAARTDPPETGAHAATDKALPANGDDVLSMTLPETITVIQLLDLVGKHVGLNYVYDPRDINNQPMALKLHGEQRGELRIRDLYALLETVLDFMNLAMIRREQNFVAIVPVDKALQAQPELVDGDAVQVGDTVVTRVFRIEHADVSSVVALLQNMKLSVAATPLDHGNLLLVTCHAGRMNRIEQLVEMIDCPGRPPECRFRRLSYVRATPLIGKIRTLAGELESIAVKTPSPAKPAAAPGTPKPAAGKPPEPVQRRAVYLDTDERTNRILMVGFPEELTLLEELIDILDVGQEDARSPHIYTIKHVDAQQVLDKLQKLEVLKSVSGGAGSPEGAAGSDELTGEPLVAVLETTNQLVVKAAPDQHARIREFLAYLDVAPTDTRTIAAYRIRYIDVHTAKETLDELDLVSVDAKASSFIAGPNQPATRDATAVPITQPAGNPLQKAPMVVSESTNTLLVKATPEQHARIAKIVQYIDRYTPEEEWTYQVYPLESSSPDHLAGLLERLIQETTKDQDGKIERITSKTQEQITIVPDPNTFSLIVHASQKSQKWIERLIARLDKRRPQVLIDVTLVEITRTDTFEYDLNVVASVDNPVIGNLVVDPIQTADSESRLEGGFNLLDQDGNPTGRTRAFYSDRHVQALLTAMQRKNYGRVLAKPKVLVDDGRKGQILTTDTTTYVKESIQIPQTGAPITTREFVPIEASIELEITPHISEGNLLRLDVFMSRDDFGTRPLSGAPPDKATSEVTTTVFVPDDRTVILGGLVKLNQSKGGSKVPILGDLPLVGVLFRSVDNSDIEKKLYVFLKANIVRPYDGSGLPDLQAISEEHREAFEQSESEFQEHETIPGIPADPMPPEGVLRDYK